MSDWHHIEQSVTPVVCCSMSGMNCRYQLQYSHLRSNKLFAPHQGTVLYRHHTVCLGSSRSFPCYACLSSNRSTYTWQSASKLGQQWFLQGTWRLGSERLVRHTASRVGQPHSLPATFSAHPFKVQPHRHDCSSAHFLFHALQAALATCSCRSFDTA